MSETVDAREELALLMSELRATLAWEELRGARLFHREAFADPADLPMAGWTAPTPQPGGSPPAGRGASRSAPSRSAPARSSPPRETPARKPPARSTPPSFGRGAERSAGPTSSPPAGASQGSGARGPSLFGGRGAPTRDGAPARAKAPDRGQGQLGAWGRFSGAQGSESPSVGPVTVEGLEPGLDLAGVREVMGDCTRCGLCKGRSKIVFGVGAPKARLMIVGEAPGFQEDRQGEPFVGPAGQMLDRMVENVLGLRRDEVYIANVVKCRPPRNRNPEPQEIASCRPFLDAQIEAVAPDVILVLGRIASQTLFQTSRGITRLRGSWKSLEIGQREVPVMCTFHPAYLLRKPADKRLTFQDLKALRTKMDELQGG